MNRSEGGLLQTLLDLRLIFPDLAARDLAGVLREMADRLAAAGVVQDPAELAQRLCEREKLGCTSLGLGVALPHCKVREIEEVVLAVGLSRLGVDFGAADGAPVTLLFLILSPTQAPAAHLQALARISRILRMPGVADNLRSARTPEEVAEAVSVAESSLLAPV